MNKPKRVISGPGYDPATDPQRFRVTLICRCQADYAEGFGHNEPEVFKNAYKFYNVEHKNETPSQEVVDKTTADGSRYEPAYTHQVWSGALMASGGKPQDGDKWVPCVILETKGDSVWVGPWKGHCCVWVPATQVKELS